MIKCALQYILEIKSNQLKSNQKVLEERGKPEYPEKNLSEQSREPTNSAYIWRQVRESNPGHIGGRRVLSPLRQPCSNPAPTLLQPYSNPTPSLSIEYKLLSEILAPQECSLNEHNPRAWLWSSHRLI